MDPDDTPRLQVNSSTNHESGGTSKKKARKSRSKGLRTRNGCITCRKRHKKCDELVPRCSNCETSDRTCIWPVLKAPAPSGNAPGPAVSPEQVHAITGQASHSPLEERQVTFSTPENTGQPSTYSPSNTVTSDFLTADLASVRWLDLLAADAVQANRGFSRAGSPVAEAPYHNFAQGAPLESMRVDERFGVIDSENSADSGYLWQLDKDIVLKDFETLILRNFVDRAALWLDVFDPYNHFSVYAIHLALRNVGLMKAILALSAQHLSRQKLQNSQDATFDPNLAVQYYYETLHYVQTALQYNSYAHSEEILATAIVISTYEMLDESDTGWQRHLKGVFWIQRSQDVHGASGGIRQAVWWAWLRQDVWAAFRERRRCFSFWKPLKDYPELNKHELADRATYLFSQTVNYCADPGDTSLQARSERADELLRMLERWKSFLSDEFKPLPTARTGTVFQPLWIHPPKFGVALQIYYFARILIILHRPALPGFKSYLKSQRSLSEAVAVICGVAMELRDEGCQIVSSQCLYGAGLCVQEPAQRAEIISLIESCESRTGWPMSTMRDDLYKEWKKVDTDDGDKDI